jgi:integrase
VLPVEILTDARIRSATPPEAGILELWDGKTSGLCFRVMKSGVRSWTFRYRNVGDDAETVANLKADRPTPHDLRRTLATGLARLGIPRDDRLAVLAHSYGDVHEVYDQFERLPQKRAALEAWERHVRKVTADQPVDDEGEVLPLWR